MSASDRDSVSASHLDPRDAGRITPHTFRDPLTGLPNRAYFLDRAAQALADPLRNTPALLVLDLDDFKAVNDEFGFEAGDLLLASVAKRLTDTLRFGDIAARFGGDEFVILVNGIADNGDVMRVARRMLDAIERPHRIGGRLASASASVGIALSGGRRMWPADLLRHAEVALREAKEAGGGHAIIFDDQTPSIAPDDATREVELRRAIRRGEFRLHYQPEVDITTREILGVESLIRWQHPTQGLLPPSSIIPFAEQTNLITDVGAWVLNEATRLAGHWTSSGDRTEFSVGVNLSARQFHDPIVVDLVARALRATGIDPKTLRLEITETAMFDDLDAAARSVDALKALGVQLALDDFGSGFSSLTHLRRFHVDVLKIDTSFVQALETSDRTAAIVGALISLAHGLDMVVTAEGIETEGQLRRLRELGCDRGQGYLFSEPTHHDEISRALGLPPL